MTAHGVQLAPLPPEPPLPRAAAGTPLYVHLPFCAAKCHYCDFFSVPDEGQDVDGMVAAILAEAEARAPERPRTVFLGGGTPSLLSVPQLTRLLDGLEKLTGFRASAVEVTAECNPESLDEDKARALLDLGVGRLSLGVQSLSDEVLTLFGRVHSVADSFAAFRAARRAGVEHLNVDLIYAAPGQNEGLWTEDIHRILDLGPEHVAAYNLTFEEETRFKRWLEQEKLSKAPDELELALLQIARGCFAAAGLAPYEVSNYAIKGEQCRHNINYWRNGPYVGLGPGAVSKVLHARAGSPRAIQPYLRWVREAGHATLWREELAPRARLGETWWLGLRLAEGVDPAEARAAAGYEGPSGDGEQGAGDPALPVAGRLVASGHLERAGERVRLTAAGLPVADAVAREFLRALGD